MATLPAKRLTLAEKNALFKKIMDSISSKLNELKEVVKLNPMKEGRVAPKVVKMARTTKVIGHKAIAMQGLDKKDMVSFERYLDRALVAAQLLEDIVDDALMVAKTG